jgi:hypothetical protein
MALGAACGGGGAPPADEPPAPAVAASVLPADGEPEGWSRVTEPETYDAGNLWDYINGQAPFFIDYGFVRVDAAEYVHDEDSTSVLLEVYEMGRPQEAFGIFAAERTQDDRPLEVGAGAYLGANVLGFWQGTRYVKLTSFEESPEIEALLIELAEAMSAQIPGRGEELETLRLFPAEGRIEASERFIPKNFLGQPYLTDGYRVDYIVDGEDLQLFVVESESADEAQTSFDRLQAFYLERGDGQLTVESAEGSPMLIVDGTTKVVVLQVGKRLGGAIATGSIATARAGAAELAEAMRK